MIFVNEERPLLSPTCRRRRDGDHGEDSRAGNGSRSFLLLLYLSLLLLLLHSQPPFSRLPLPVPFIFSSRWDGCLFVLKRQKRRGLFWLWTCLRRGGKGLGLVWQFTGTNRLIPFILSELLSGFGFSIRRHSSHRTTWKCIEFQCHRLRLEKALDYCWAATKRKQQAEHGVTGNCTLQLGWVVDICHLTNPRLGKRCSGKPESKRMTQVVSVSINYNQKLQNHGFYQ